MTMTSGVGDTNHCDEGVMDLQKSWVDHGRSTLVRVMIGTTKAPCVPGLPTLARALNFIFIHPSKINTLYSICSYIYVKDRSAK